MQTKTFLTLFSSLAIFLFTSNIMAMDKKRRNVPIEKKYLKEEGTLLDFSTDTDTYGDLLSLCFKINRDGKLPSCLQRVQRINLPYGKEASMDMMRAFSKFKYLKIIDFNWVRKMQGDLLLHAPDVESLILDGCRTHYHRELTLEAKDLTHLKKKKNLKGLSLIDLHKIGDDVFKELPNTIEHLNVMSTGLTDGAIPNICKYLPNLKKIVVARCPDFTIKGLYALAEKGIDVKTGLQYKETFDAGLHRTISLGGEKNELNLAGSKITDKEFITQKSDEIETINIACAPNLTDESIKNLHERFPNLKKLIVVGCNISIGSLWVLLDNYRSATEAQTKLVVVTGLN